MRARALSAALAMLLATVAPLAHADTHGTHASCARRCSAARLHRRLDPRRHVPHLSSERISARAPGRTVARAPQTFYVDSAFGRDANPGTSPSAPWRTLGRADRGSYIGGDSIRLRGGEQFVGALGFNPGNVTGTSPQAQLTIGSYGAGQATLDQGRRRFAIKAVNVAGFHISGLELAGRHTSCRPHSYGILFLTENSFTTLDQGIDIDHVDVHGFCDGIAIASRDDNSRFAHIRLTDLLAHDNADAGVFTFDPALAHHDIHDVYVSGVQAYNNAGTGGIALFGVEGGTIEHSVAHDNGRAGSGGVGIWAFDADHITIQYSESYANRTTSEDGDGFDLDGGVSNSVMQYDYSHDNEGIGFLVCVCVSFYSAHNDVVRYDVSQNDGTNGQPSGLYLLGGEPFEGLEVFNNSFYSQAGAGPLVLLEGEGQLFPGVHLRNNLLAVAAGKPLLELPDPEHATGIAIQGNDWWPGEGRFDVLWGSRSLASLAEVRAGTGMESVAGQPLGLSAAPEVCALGHGATMYPESPQSLTAYELRSGSPLIGAGLDLAKLFGTEVGAHDFGGDPVARESSFDVGADERRTSEVC
jgi:hypothetical protein